MELYQGVADHPKVSSEPFYVTEVITVFCLKVLDTFEKKFIGSYKRNSSGHAFGALLANKLANLLFFK